VREPRNYDALRDSERKVRSEQEFVITGREATVRAEHSAPAAQRQAEASEPPFMTHEERHEAARAALIEKLDAGVRSNRIDHHERRYQLQQFETNGLRLQNDAPTHHDRPRISSRGLGVMDRADLVSQHAAARQRLKQAMARSEAGLTPDRARDPSRKPPGIER
jgi:hypothetical protein